MTALQGATKYTKVTDDPQFHALSPEDQSYVLDRVDPDFHGLNSEDKAAVITGIRDAYSPPKTNFFGDLYNHAVNAGTGYTQDQLIKNSGHGIGAFLGDLGGGLVPIIGGSAAGGITGSVVPGVGTAIGSFGGGVLGATTGGTLQDLQAQRLAGVNSPDWGRAVTSGAIQGGLQAVPIAGKAAPALKRITMNALLHGGGAAAGDVVQQGAEQRTFLPNIDFNRLRSAAALGAAGGSFAASFHKAPPKVVPRERIVNGQIIKHWKTKGPVNYLKIGRRVNGQVMTPNQKAEAELLRGIQDRINEATAKESVSLQKTLQAKKSAFQKIYEDLSEAANNKAAMPGERRIQNAAREKVLQGHVSIEQRYQTLYGKKPKAQKAPLEHITNEADLKALVGLIKEMRQAGNSKQADVALSRFSRETKARVYDEVKRQETQIKQKRGSADAQAKERYEAANTRVRQGQQVQKSFTEAQKQERVIADQKAKQRAEEANTRVRQRQAFDKERGRELIRQEKAAQARIKALEVELEKIQNLKDKQAIKDRIALEKAESENRKRELRQLRAAIEGRHKQAQAEATQNKKQSTQGGHIANVLEGLTKKPEPKTGTANELTAKGPDEYAEMAKDAKIEQQRQKAEATKVKATEAAPVDHEQNKKTLDSAIEKGQSVKFEHRAEKAGTRDESTFRAKHDVPYERGSNEKGDFVRTINENGQVTMRYLDDIHSNIEISKDRHPYAYDREGIYKGGKKKGESGRFRVLDEDGNEVAQVRSNLTKDSEIVARIQKMEDIVNAVNNGKRPKVNEILDAARNIEKYKDLEDAMDGLSDNSRRELIEKLTGEPC
jgi:hypothetical protein